MTREEQFRRTAAEIVDLYGQDSKCKETLTSVIAVALDLAYLDGQFDGPDGRLKDDH